MLTFLFNRKIKQFFLKRDSKLKTFSFFYTFNTFLKTNYNFNNNINNTLILNLNLIPVHGSALLLLDESLLAQLLDLTDGDGGHESGATTASVLRQHQGEPVVREFGDLALHQVVEVRVIAVHRAVHAHRRVLPLHLVEDGGHRRRDQMRRPGRDARADHLHAEAVVVGGVAQVHFPHSLPRLRELVGGGVGLDPGHEGRLEAVGREELLRALAAEEQVLAAEVRADGSHHFAHVHPGDHLLE